MKKWIALFLLIFQLSVSLSAIEHTENEKENENLTMNIGIGFVYPIDDDWSVGGNILGSICFSSLYCGLGYHFSILPNIFMPGLYGEINFWLLPLLIQYLMDPDREIKDYDVDVMDGGIRIYNLFRFGSFDLSPFVGINMGFLRGFSMMYGSLLAYKNFGIEYSFFKLYSSRINTDIMHRIAIVYHF